MNFKIYMYTAKGIQYLDGTAQIGYSFQTAIDFARENASAMPNKRIYVQNGDTMRDVQSFYNHNGKISVELY